MNLSGRDTNISISQNKIEAFTKKLQIWKNRINGNVLDMFPALSDYIANKPLINKILILPDIQKRLELLSEHFKKYFVKKTYKDFNWVFNPFAAEKTKF